MVYRVQGQENLWNETHNSLVAASRMAGVEAVPDLVVGFTTMGAKPKRGCRSAFGGICMARRNADSVPLWSADAAHQFPLLLASGFVFNRPAIYEPNSSSDDHGF